MIPDEGAVAVRPLVTIVTAVRDRVETIGDAVASVRAQTWPSVEHVVVDGVSTDGTLDALRGLAAPSMLTVSEPDTGIYDALNKGLARARGDVVGLLHSDDLFADATVLERVVHAFEDPAIDVVYGDLEYVSAADPSRVVRHWRAGAYAPGRLRRGWMPPHPTLFFRREVAARHGGFDTSYRIAADYDLVLRWFGSGEVVAAYVPDVLVRMRTGGASNRSLRQILRKTGEDYRALSTNALHGRRPGRVAGALTLVSKNVSKLPQLVRRRRHGE